MGYFGAKKISRIGQKVRGNGGFKYGYKSTNSAYFYFLKLLNSRILHSLFGKAIETSHIYQYFYPHNSGVYPKSGQYYHLQTSSKSY
jgi:hypothetical protein